jgi:hypothetical protein
LVTTTAHKLHEENETRLLSIFISDTREQTRAVLYEIARRQGRPSVDLSEWHALQEYLQAERPRVRVPYAEDLADLIPPTAVRLRRDFAAFLALIQTHAMLHFATRRRDSDGTVVASLDDYAAIRDLVANVIAEGVEVTVSSTVRTTVEAVRQILGNHEDAEATVTAVAKVLGVEKPTALRRVRLAIEEGYLRNLEERRGRPARLVLGHSLPESSSLFPTPDRLGEEWSGPDAMHAHDALEERYRQRLRGPAVSGPDPAPVRPADPASLDRPEGD